MREESAEIEVETAEGPGFVTITQMAGMPAAKMLVRLTGIMGPAISGLAVALKGNNAGEAAKAAALLVDRLPDGEFEKIALALLRGARVRVGDNFIDLTSQNIDSLFRGNSEGLFTLVYEALKGNYARFFSKAEVSIKSALKGFKLPTQTIPNPIPSPQTPESSGLPNP